MLLLLLPPWVFFFFYHTLKAMFEGPINGFWLSHSSGINIELQEYATQ